MSRITQHDFIDTGVQTNTVLLPLLSFKKRNRSTIHKDRFTYFEMTRNSNTEHISFTCWWGNKRNWCLFADSGRAPLDGNGVFWSPGGTGGSQQAFPWATEGSLLMLATKTVLSFPWKRERRSHWPSLQGTLVIFFCFANTGRDSSKPSLLYCRES